MKLNTSLKFSLLAVFFVGAVILIWDYLPIEIRNHSEVNFGHQLVDKIEKYKSVNSSLPSNGEWKTLEKLDFEMTELGTNPEYKKINDSSYKLIFVKGFDGPYLTYNSLLGTWSVE